MGGSTALTLNGQTPVAQLQPGSEVRASYQSVDGQAKALTVNVTSPGSAQAQPQK